MDVVELDVQDVLDRARRTGWRQELTTWRGGRDDHRRGGRRRGDSGRDERNERRQTPEQPAQRLRTAAAEQVRWRIHVRLPRDLSTCAALAASPYSTGQTRP